MKSQVHRVSNYTRGRSRLARSVTNLGLSDRLAEVIEANRPDPARSAVAFGAHAAIVGEQVGR